MSFSHKWNPDFPASWKTGDSGNTSQFISLPLTYSLPGPCWLFCLLVYMGRWIPNSRCLVELGALGPDHKEHCLVSHLLGCCKSNCSLNVKNNDKNRNYFCTSLIVLLLTSYLTSLRLSFSFCKMRTIKIQLTSEGCCEEQFIESSGSQGVGGRGDISGCHNWGGASGI